MTDTTPQSTSTTSLQKSHSASAEGSDRKTPKVHSSQPNAVGVDGCDYVLPVGTLTETFVDDLHSMAGTDLITKYNLEKFEDGKSAE